MAEELSEFDIARKRARSQAGREAEQRKQSLQRRAAQLGGGTGRGTLLKAEQTVERERGEQIAGAEEQIGAAERAEARRKREIAEGRQFSREERLGSEKFAGEQAGLGREFAAGESALGREFAREERLGSEKFASAEALLGREFSTSEREAGEVFAALEAEKGRVFENYQARIDREIQKGQFETANALKKEMFDDQLSFDRLKMQEATDQFAAQFGLDVAISEQNQALQEYMAGPGFIEYLVDIGLRDESVLGGGGGGSALTGLAKNRVVADPRFTSLSPTAQDQVLGGQITLDQAIFNARSRPAGG
jgi:hypothetical protein